jgi:hypothetical protein
VQLHLATHLQVKGGAGQAHLSSRCLSPFSSDCVTGMCSYTPPAALRKGWRSASTSERPLVPPCCSSINLHGKVQLCKCCRWRLQQLPEGEGVTVLMIDCAVDGPCRSCPMRGSVCCSDGSCSGSVHRVVE